MKRCELAAVLSPHLFWDVDQKTLDPEAHQGFLIARVMDRGTIRDVQAVREVYTQAEILEAMLSARSLSRKTISYFAAIFDVPRTRFRAYKPAFEGTWRV